MSVKPSYKITGQIIDRKQRHGIAGLRIYAWDKDIVTRDELLGGAVTDDEGRFEITFEFPRVRTLWTLWEDIIDWRPDLYFEVSHQGKPISDFDVVYPDMAHPLSSDSVRWNVPANALNIIVELGDPSTKQPTKTYTIIRCCFIQYQWKRNRAASNRSLGQGCLDRRLARRCCYGQRRPIRVGV